MKTAQKKQRGRTQEKLFEDEASVRTKRAQTRLKYIHYSITALSSCSQNNDLRVKGAERDSGEKGVDFF